MNDQKSYKLLAFAPEKVALSLTDESTDLAENGLTGPNYTLSFAAYSSDVKISDYDGVIFFEGIFEEWREVKPAYGESYIKYKYDEPQLSRRMLEVHALLRKGGFVCGILWKTLLTEYDGTSYKYGDIAKRLLTRLRYTKFKYPGNPLTNYRINIDEFRQFLEEYGAANNVFVNADLEDEEVTLIAQSPNDKKLSLGLLIARNQYFIPSLIPSSNPSAVSAYFKSLCNALTNSQNKVKVDAPNWLKEYRFGEEIELNETRLNLEQQMNALQEREIQLLEFKRILYLSGEDLRLAVINLFMKGFEIEVNPIDSLIEDFKLIGANGKPLCLCEVKGVNKNIGDADVNQADSHREPAGYDDDMPVILFANTAIKQTNQVKDKYLPFNERQIKRAIRNRVLLLRTIDLLNLFEMYNSKIINKDDILKLFCGEVGWLRIESNQIGVVKA